MRFYNICELTVYDSEHGYWHDDDKSHYIGKQGDDDRIGTFRSER